MHLVTLVLIYVFLSLTPPLYGQQRAGNDIIYLEGSWQFIPDRFVDPGEADTLPWQEIMLPGPWNSYAFRDGGAFGFGTFSRKIILPEHADRYAVRLPDVLSAHRVYTDTLLLYESGKVATNRRSEIFGNYKYIRALPPNYAGGDTVRLLVHVSNFHHRTGGILRTPEIGSYEVMQRAKQIRIFVEAVQMGGVGVMGLFFFIYFLFRQTDRYNITFALLCAGIFTYVFFNGDYMLFTLFPDISGETILDVIYIAFYLGVTLNFILISELFPEEIPHWTVLLVKIIGVFAVLSVVLLPPHLYSFALPVFRIYAILSSLYLIVQIFRAAARHRSGAKIIWLAFTIIFLVMVNDLLYNAHLLNTGEFIGWGVMIYLMLLMVVSSRKFSAAITNEERLLKDLRRLNENLSYKVQERTRDLEEKSRIIEEQQRRILLKNEELMRAREEEKGLLKSVVHDLKSPFNKITGLISVFRMEKQKGSAPEDLGKIFQMVETVAREGSQMIEDLNVLTFFNETIQGEGVYEEIDLIQLLNDLILGHMGNAERKGITINFTAPSQKYLIKTHSRSLTRIIDNLLSNAIKFSPHNTAVGVLVKPGHSQFELHVTDQGPGFTPEDRQNLFQKFRKLSARPTSGESSTGLGLSIVKTLTEGLGGSVTLQQDPERTGAHFLLIFPRNAGDDLPDHEGL